MPGRVPREVDLFSSYPCPQQHQQQQQKQRIKNAERPTRVWQIRRQVAQASVKRRQKVARRWAWKLLNVGRFPGGGVGWRGRARQAGRASITGGDRSDQREESTIQRRDRSGEDGICGWPAGRACGTDGTQVASEKRPQQRGDFGGSIAYFESKVLPTWMFRSFSTGLTEFPTFRLARIAPSRGFWASNSNFKSIISERRNFFNERFSKYHLDLELVLPYLIEKLFRFIHEFFFRTH